MKLTLRDIIIIALTTTLSFPIIYLLILFATGGARIEINQPKKMDEKKEQQIKLVKLSAKKDSITASQSQTFVALEQQKADLAVERAALNEKQQQVTMVQQELDKTRADLKAEREKLEKLVSQSDDLDKKRIKQLAKVYGAMRADEAARILETLDDDLCINILSSMGDDRQKAKVLAALSPEKASKVSKKISMPLKAKKELK